MTQLETYSTSLLAKSPTSIALLGGSEEECNGEVDPLAMECTQVDLITEDSLHEPMLPSDQYSQTISMTTADQNVHYQDPSYRPRTTSRLGEHCKFFPVGFLLLAVSLGLLVHRESRELATRTFYYQASQQIQELSLLDDQYIIQNPTFFDQPKLVHVVGTMDTLSNDVTIRDDTFGFQSSTPRIIKLFRSVEMYQWVESDTYRKSGDDVYRQDWDSMRLDSEDYAQPENHSNPLVMRFESQAFTCNDIQMGPYRMSSTMPSFANFVEQFDGFYQVLDEPIRLPNSYMRTNVTGYCPTLADNDRTLYLSPCEDNSPTRDPSQDPRIGDYRIVYRAIQAQTISVLAEQHQEQGTDKKTTLTFVPWRNNFLLVESGVRSASEMMEKAQMISTRHTNVWRCVCAVMVYFACLILAKPASVLEDAIPAVATVVGPNFVLGTASVHMIPVAALITTVTINFVWWSYHPWTSCCLLLFQVFVVYKIGQYLEWWKTSDHASRLLDQMEHDPFNEFHKLEDSVDDLDSLLLDTYVSQQPYMELRSVGQA